MIAPLQGIKVIDWTQVQSGPSCTQMLAWLGADVIKIERTGVGDPTRSELLDYPDLDGLYFLQLNCNKRSIELDVKTPGGKEILTRLLKEADIFVENLHPGAADKLGFSWKEVHRINPRLIYGTIKGFNDDSPFANVKAFEPVAQCAGGAAATTGWWGCWSASKARSSRCWSWRVRCLRLSPVSSSEAVTRRMCVSEPRRWLSVPSCLCSARRSGFG